MNELIVIAVELQCILKDTY